MIITAIFGGLLVTALLMSFTQMMVNRFDYKFYKLTYQALITKEFVPTQRALLYADELITFKQKDGNNRKEIILFVKNNKVGSIKLIENGAYIHGSTSWFDPYTTYWFNKIIGAVDWNELETVQKIDFNDPSW